VLVHGAALNRHVDKAPRAPYKVGNCHQQYEFRVLQTRATEIIEQSPPGRFAFPTHVLVASNTFWPSLRTPSATSSEMAVAFLSRRTRTTVPIKNKADDAHGERAGRFQASQSPLVLRQTR